ncbi:8.6 kDa transglutaminase substrate-like [Stegodyphus dumicola]|uniref:8.6 kDa transglutaminase substrate-like n=1 Tax=Stegodyphus dumicola TaxID=202533 RepID=UPI0015ADFECF|nr:8.6 kDa transglutaminase substrate-like [Stegodyphus dumicola]
MKTFVYISILAATLALFLVSVESYSVPNCNQCDRRMCPPIYNCWCGYYMDYCGCCPICYRCPGERCSSIANERCAGSRCMTPDGIPPALAINYPGQCL